MHCCAEEAQRSLECITGSFHFDVSKTVAAFLFVVVVIVVVAVGF